MQTITANERKLMDAYAPIRFQTYMALSIPFTVPGKLGDVVMLDPISLSYSASVCGGNSLSIGNAMSAEVRFTLAGTGTKLKKKYIFVRWSVDGTTWHPLFTGKVVESTIENGCTSAVAYDSMSIYGGRALKSYKSVPKSKTNVADTMKVLAKILGLSTDSKSTLTLATGLKNMKNDATVADACGTVAACMGGNCIVNREGVLTIKSFKSVSYETECYLNGLTAEDSDYNPTGLVFTDIPTGDNETTEVTAGASSGMWIPCPIGTQIWVDRAYEKIKDIKVRPGTYSIPNGLLIEPGDVIVINGYQVAVCSISMTIDGGVKSSIRCLGKDETSHAYSTKKDSDKTKEDDPDYDDYSGDPGGNGYDGFRVESVSELPDNPDSNTIYLIQGTVIMS